MPNLTPYKALGHSIICLDAPVTLEADADALVDYADLVSSATEQNDVLIIVPFSDPAAAATFAAFDSVKTSYRIIAACYPGATGLEPEISVSVAAVISAEADPALPFNGLNLPALPRLPSQFDLLKGEIEALLQSGVAVIAPDFSGKPAIVRLITTYQVDPTTGQDDELLLDANAPLILRYVRRVTRRTIERAPRRKNTRAQRAQLRSELLAEYLKLDDAEILQNVRARQQDLIVTESATDKARANVRVPTDFVRGMHVVAATLDVY